MSMTALVVGDLVLEYQYAIAPPYSVVNHGDRSSPVQHTDVLLGGAAAVAQVIAALGCKVLLAGLTGDDEHGKTLETLIAGAGVTACISKKLPRTNLVQRTTLDGADVSTIVLTQRTGNADTSEILASLYQLPANLLAEIGVIVIADYEYGGVVPELVYTMSQLSTTYHVPVVVVTTGGSCGLRQGFDLVVSNTPVAEKLFADVVHPALAVECSPSDRCHSLCYLLRQQLYAKAAVLVDDRAVYFTDPDDAHHVHAVDTNAGCHVAPMRQLTLAAATAAVNYCEQKSLSNAAARLTHALAVADVGGDVTADTVSERAYVAIGWPAKLQDKHGAKLFADRRRRMRPGCRLVLVTGIFDGLSHTGIEAIRHAAKQGDCVIVATDSDEQLVRSHTDAVVPASFRMTHLAMLPDVDAVFATSEDDIELVRHFKPEVYMPIGCNMANMGRGADYVAAHGGRVEFAPEHPYTM